ncbi:MAG: cytochrome c biogenesis protein CcdA, partial [Chitinophagaceae bacterium]
MVERFQMKYLFSFFLFFAPAFLFAQDSLKWESSSQKIAEGEYALSFTTTIPAGSFVYLSGAVADGPDAFQVQFADSSIQFIGKPGANIGGKDYADPLFAGAVFQVGEDKVTVVQKVKFTSGVPMQLRGKLVYTIGGTDLFLPGQEFAFETSLEGGTIAASKARLNIPSIDITNPMVKCGDAAILESDESLWGLFVLGFLGGLIALLTPCVFPMIPLTVSFFTKKSGDRRKGISNALIYGFFIFLIYVLLSLPFHFLDTINPEILNQISTNVVLNLIFFVVFLFFAFSFFGYYEISLPASLANRVDAKSSVGNLSGIFFMAI